jgi:NADH-quinone oxidoreductase subunit A
MRAGEHPYLFLLVLMAGGVLFCTVPLLLARLWAVWYSPRKPGPAKNASYECGLESPGDAWIQFQPAYYLYAIVFLVFDVEAVFLYPFAAAFTGLGAGACLAMGLFVLLVLEGLVWAWQKGFLRWH